MNNQGYREMGSLLAGTGNLLRPIVNDTLDTTEAKGALQAELINIDRTQLDYSTLIANYVDANDSFSLILKAELNI